MKGQVSSPFMGGNVEGTYATTIRQDFPNVPMCIDPAMHSSSSRSDLFETRF